MTAFKMIMKIIYIMMVTINVLHSDLSEMAIKGLSFYHCNIFLLKDNLILINCQTQLQSADMEQISRLMYLTKTKIKTLF